MKRFSDSLHPVGAIACLSGTLLSLILLSTPAAVLAHAGHGDEFHGESHPSQSADSIHVDAETTQRLGIVVAPVSKQRLDVGVKTTGQIETLSSKKVEVTAPIAGKVVELSVEPGALVKAGQTVAVLSSPELIELRVTSQEKRADAEADLQKAIADLKLAQENYQLQQKIAESEIAQAKTRLAAAQSQYDRDRRLVDEKAVLKVARENYQRQLSIAEAEIAQAQTEFAVAQEQYDRDRELVASGALPRRQMLESQAHLANAKASLAKALSRRNVLEAEAEVKRAEVALPLRELRESEGKLAEMKAQLTRANSRREVLEAEAQLKRAQSAVELAQSRRNLSDTTYQTRLQQLGTRANAKGLVTVTAPIAGTVADREVTLGQTFEEAGAKLMTLVNDNRVFATANIYEKDLDRVKMGQRVRVKVASLPNRTFTGQISVIGSAVAGETRVVPVKAELDNPGGVLKPGMFAELEVLTTQTPETVVTVPSTAVVEANGKSLVYVQNGTAFEPEEVVLGQTSGEFVEVKSGLFEGDRIVTQGAIQLYAQSLRGGSKQHRQEAGEQTTTTPNSVSEVPWLWVIPAGGAIAAGAFWLGRRTRRTQTPAIQFLDFSIPPMEETSEVHTHQPTSKH